MSQEIGPIRNACFDLYGVSGRQIHINQADKAAKATDNFEVAETSPTADYLSPDVTEQVSTQRRNSVASQLQIPQSLLNYSLETPGLSIMGMNSKGILALKYNDEPLHAETRRLKDGELRITKMFYRGAPVNFHLINDSHDLSPVLSSIDSALSFIKRRKDLSSHAQTASFEGGVENGVIFSLQTGSGEVSFFADTENVYETPSKRKIASSEAIKPTLSI